MATAQIQFPVGLPTPKVGDLAKYRTLDLWNNSELSASENELVEISANNFVTRFKSSVNSEPSTSRSDRSWNACRSMRNSDAIVCEGSLRFPIQSGNKHSYKDYPNDTGRSKFDAACEVIGQEKVTVSAGIFDTIRINCAGFYTRIFDGNWSGKFNSITWYSPAINRIVKSQYFDFNAGGTAFNKNQTELVEFTAGK